MRWHDKPFRELTIDELYSIIALRERVFVVEQACAYQDADGLDRQSHHVWAEQEGSASMNVVAYLRIVPAGAKFDEVSIGRVVTAPEVRGTGIGRLLMKRGIELAGGPIRIGAQAHLERFYNELGFVRASDVYDEDGISHIEMTRA